MKNPYKQAVEEMLQFAGVTINGSNPWDIRVHNESFYKRALTGGELGVGESYMDGWWDAERTDEFISRVLNARLEKKVKNNPWNLFRLFVLRMLNLQSKKRAFIIGEKHYDLGNDLFQSMLDKRMNYSCAYWKDAADLDEAQEKKLDLVCRKICLEPGMRVLDIGCGWGAFGKYAAEKYDVRVTGITVSKNQAELGKKMCKGLPVEFHLVDYRELNEKFDRIVSIGMFEHVGYKNYRTFFKVAERCLAEHGLMLLHTIGNPGSVKSSNLWIHKYIFPNGMIPSAAQIGKAIDNIFLIQDWHNFGTDYDKTLMSWYGNFVKNREQLKDKYSGRFFRMWEYFLLSCAGSFRTGINDQLWQIVLSANGIPGGYLAAR